MAGSSRRVVDALHRMRKTTSSVQENKPPRIAAQGQEGMLNFSLILYVLSTTVTR